MVKRLLVAAQFWCDINSFRLGEEVETEWNDSRKEGEPVSVEGDDVGLQRKGWSFNQDANQALNGAF